MAKKLSFDQLPEAVARILEILSSEGSEHTALPELLARVALLEKKIEYLQTLVSPDKPVMDMPTVCRVLKLRPKAVSELAASGVLPSRAQGRKTVFYEEGVMKYFAARPAWRSAMEPAAKPAPEEPAFEEPVLEEIAAEGRRRVDIHAASVILERAAGAVRQLLKKIPHHKEGRRIYFYTDELREWAKTNRPLKRKPKTHETETAEKPAEGRPKRVPRRRDRDARPSAPEAQGASVEEKV